MKKLVTFALGLASLLVVLPSVHAQAIYTATRSSRIQAGAGVMYLNNDFTLRNGGGATAWLEYDFTHLFGAVAEAHFGGLITPDDVGENSYLIGPKVSYHRGKFEIYGKLVVGRGTIFNQQYNTSSAYNIYAFGGGVDYRIKPKYTVRVDFEEQKWPNFEPHTLSPIAVSVGVLYVIR